MTKCAEVHFNLGLGGYKSCLCTCENCFSDTLKCLCPTCSCKDPRMDPPQHQPGYIEPPVVIEHPCSECGAEVTRNGTRGRWPSKCLECK